MLTVPGIGTTHLRADHETAPHKTPQHLRNKPQQRPPSPDKRNIKQRYSRPTLQPTHNQLPRRRPHQPHIILDKPSTSILIVRQDQLRTKIDRRNQRTLGKYRLFQGEIQCCSSRYSRLWVGLVGARCREWRAGNCHHS